MRLRHLIFPIQLVTACTTEENLKTYSVTITNSSLLQVEVLGFSGNTLVFSKHIEPTTNVKICSYVSESFNGITCQNDSIVFKFSNSKGYACDLRGGIGNYCFKNKTPFVNESSFIKIGENSYSFVVDEKDLENAYVLP